MNHETVSGKVLAALKYSNLTTEQISARFGSVGNSRLSILIKAGKVIIVEQYNSRNKLVGLPK